MPKHAIWLFCVLCFFACGVCVRVIDRKKHTLIVLYPYTHTPIYSRDPCAFFSAEPEQSFSQLITFSVLLVRGCSEPTLMPQQGNYPTSEWACLDGKRKGVVAWAWFQVQVGSWYKNLEVFSRRVEAKRKGRRTPPEMLEITVTDPKFIGTYPSEYVSYKINTKVVCAQSTGTFSHDAGGTDEPERVRPLRTRRPRNRHARVHCDPALQRFRVAARSPGRGNSLF